MSQLRPTPLPAAAAFALGLLVVVLGVVITARAYQGHRRNESRPMLYLAVGMLLITVVPSLAEMVVVPFVARYFAATAPAIEYTLVASRASEAAGILVLLYSLRARE
ncbi:DUF7521 family protein [Halorarius halobius]|uniref:DUF7521 family protein n=1 Tax=Halorarius halobius TaxID=2962671 RepID=UPI0020CC2DB8|nr:hypothetical protein [Halorarius halobius]